MRRAGITPRETATPSPAWNSISGTNRAVVSGVNSKRVENCELALEANSVPGLGRLLAWFKCNRHGRFPPVPARECERLRVACPRARSTQASPGNNSP